MPDFTEQDIREKCARVKDILIKAASDAEELEAVEVVFHFMDVFAQMALDLRALASRTAAPESHPADPAQSHHVPGVIAAPTPHRS